MKITYFLAENFAGIKVGTGKDRVEIDFSKNKNPLVLLLGGNGKGKTALLSILHPLRGTNDNRSAVFEGEKAYKEVHLIEKGDLYVAKHTWKPNKSFLSKNGVELNENGNITSFNQIIKQELGLSDDYFKVGRLGNNITNFINLKSSDRKKYIGNFLPNIDEYLKLFDIAKTKYSMMRKELTNIASQLGKFPELSVLEEKVKALTEQITSVNDLITNYEKEKVVNQYALEQLISKFENINIDISDKRAVSQFKSNVLTSQGNLAKAESVIRHYTDKYPNLANYDDEKIINSIEEVNNNISSFEKNVIKLQSELDNTIQAIADLTKRITVTKGKINEDITEELEEIKEKISVEEAKLNKLNESLIDVNEAIFTYSINDFNKIKFKASKVLDMIVNNIILNYNFANYNLENINSETKLNDEYFIAKQRLEEVNNFITYTNNNIKQLEILKKRPDNCKDNTCSFIMSSLEFKTNYYDKLDKYTSEKEELENKIESLIKELEEIDEMKNFVKDCKVCMEEFNNLKDSFIPDYFGSKINSVNEFIKFLDMGTSRIESALNTDDIYQAISTKNEIDVCNNILNSYYTTKNTLVAQENSMNELIAELNELESQIEEFNEAKTTIQANIVDITKKINVLGRKKTILQELKASRDNIASTESQLKSDVELLETVENAIIEGQDLDRKISEIDKVIATQLKIKNSLEAEKSKNEKDLNYLQVLLENKDTLDKKFDATKQVKDALDPKQGIPLLFIDDFLQSITEKTNALLSIAYDDRFKISFDLTEKDFFIRVHRLFSELEDISQASQGETSMTTLSLSLSMIENMVKKYNIIYLDEIDATLSTENRRMFLTMLEKQLLDLGVEQIFIISHNNEFYSYPVDMILFHEHDVDLNDKEFMLNKNVIFDINEK